MDIRNLTPRPLKIPLPGGKVLRLGPRMTGQVTPKAAESEGVKKLLGDDTEGLRALAVWTLYRIERDNAKKLLLGSLRDKSRHVRAVAIGALAGLGTGLYIARRSDVTRSQMLWADLGAALEPFVGTCGE